MATEDESSESDEQEPPAEQELEGTPPPHFLEVKGHTAQNSKHPEADDYDYENAEQLPAQPRTEGDGEQLPEQKPEEEE